MLKFQRIYKVNKTKNKSFPCTLCAEGFFKSGHINIQNFIEWLFKWRNMEVVHNVGVLKFAKRRGK